MHSIDLKRLESIVDRIYLMSSVVQESKKLVLVKKACSEAGLVLQQTVMSKHIIMYSIGYYHFFEQFAMNVFVKIKDSANNDEWTVIFSSGIQYGTKEYHMNGENDSGPEWDKFVQFLKKGGV